MNKVQKRIAKATVAGNKKLVRELQRMLVHSHYAKLWAVKKVTSNRGKKTAGVDNEKWETSAQKYKAVIRLGSPGYKAKPLKRVYILKPNGKKRPLGIPTMHDRSMQALEALALDPIIESTSDDVSFGFRKARSAQDAREQLFCNLCRNYSAKWILEGDIKACFDEISHEWLETNTPMDTKKLKEFLKAGYLYKKELFPTETGTPQGGIISPILANHSLNGMKECIQVQAKPKYLGRCKVNQKIHLVRYADDCAPRKCA